MREYRVGDLDCKVQNIKQICFLSVLGVVLLSITVLLLVEMQMKEGWLIANSIIFAGCYALLAVQYGIRKNDYVQSQRIFLEQERLTFLALNAPMITIHKDAVIRIKIKQKGLRICSKDGGASIWVSHKLKGYKQIKDEVTGWLDHQLVDRPVRKTPTRIVRFMNWEIVIHHLK